MPCEGGEAVKPANEIPLNNIPMPVSTLVLKNLCQPIPLSGPTRKPFYFNKLMRLSNGTAPWIKSEGAQFRGLP
jgi:hypothetical protein